ncbi:MAG: G-D-S-L family lipolytic protein [Spirochaetia bacterium]|nr:G-D-S-L family lipolytic protein [Spirochaetia bacterium]
MKHILCFGDSNLFGTNPSGGRWPLEQRWTGLLSQALGSEYHIIEEGLGGRTTVFDDPLEENRNGSKQLPIMLHSHRPLDLVILSLGTNDCKTLFHANAKIIAKALEKLALMVKSYPYGEYYPIPSVLVISPIHCGEHVEDSPFASFDHDSCLLSKSLSPAIKAMAEKNSLLFLDASLVAKSSPIDQLHMDADGHAALAKAILPILLSWFGDERSVGVEDATGKITDAENGGGTQASHDGNQSQTIQGEIPIPEDQGRKEEVTSSKRGRHPLSFSFFRRKL